MRYADLGDDDQVEALRPAAVEAVARFGLHVARMELLLHAYNTTFVVDTVGGTGSRCGSTPTPPAHRLR